MIDLTPTYCEWELEDEGRCSNKTTCQVVIIPLQRVETVWYYCDEHGGCGPNTCRLEDRSEGSDPNMENAVVYSSGDWDTFEDATSRYQAIA